MAKESELKFQPLGNGLEMAVQGDRILLAMRASASAVKTAPWSSTGQSKLLANTGGSVSLPEIGGVNDLKLSVILRVDAGGMSEQDAAKARAAKAANRAARKSF